MTIQRGRPCERPDLTLAKHTHTEKVKQEGEEKKGTEIKGYKEATTAILCEINFYVT